MAVAHCCSMADEAAFAMALAVGQQLASAIASADAWATALATEVAWASPLAQAEPPSVVVVWTTTLAMATAVACGTWHTKNVVLSPPGGQVLGEGCFS